MQWASGFSLGLARGLFVGSSSRSCLRSMVLEGGYGFGVRGLGPRGELRGGLEGRLLGE